MKAVLLSAVFLIVLGTGEPGAAADDPPAASSPAMPAPVRFESARGPLLLGLVTQAAILAEFADWPLELESWQPEPVALASLTAVSSPADVVCILGTWCEDSRREVPRFWRLLELADNANLRLVMIAVGRADDAAAGRALAGLGFSADFRQEQGIEKVPTFIFSRDGREIGRIVETPAVSLEADAVEILRQAGLIPSPSQEPGAGWH
jgi:thiol-disulfide isomerase/thioredoxin